VQKAYLHDYSITDFEATIVRVEGNTISLNQTYFYPGGGHQVYDTGCIVAGGMTKSVSRVFEENGVVFHILDSTEGLNAGDQVEGRIDKARREYLSTLHTAQHVISRIVFDKYRLNTVTSEFDINGGSVVFSAPLQPEWIELIISDFDAVIQKEYEIHNKIVGDIITVSIGNYDVEDCCGTHLKNTSKLDKVFIYGIGRKNHILLYDVFSNYGNIKESLREYYKIDYMLGLKRDLYSQVSNLIDQHNLLVEETYENCKNNINTQLTSDSTGFTFGGYKASFVRVFGHDITKKAYKKVIKNSDCVYGDLDFCVIAIDNQYLFESFNEKISAKTILDKLKVKGVNVTKGGGNLKKVDFVAESENETVFVAIKEALLEVIE
jgi:Ser-tRNA(Ala) deacylase AlaX